MRSRPDGRLAALALISGVMLGYETALTRYFAVAKWSEYGYWVISIVMAGLALSGVAVALARDWLVVRQAVLLPWLKRALIPAAALGYWLATGNPFNPLQLQNPVTVAPQLWNIALYYAELLPFFFLAGLYVSLCFVLRAEATGLVYAFDLCGAGAGSVAVLLLMRALHPFLLVPALLVPLAVACVVPAAANRAAAALAAALLLAASEFLLLAGGRAAISDFKPIYAPLHVPGSTVLARLPSPRGYYMLLRDFTERLDTDLSNDAGMLGLPGPPMALGVYRDGTRIAALPRPAGRPGGPDVRYAPATLGALPYRLCPGARVLLAGTSGGFRVAEALSLGAAHVTALEPDPVLRRAERAGWGGAPGPPPDGRVTLTGESPVAAARTDRKYGIIDLSGDFLDEAEANAHAFTKEALAVYLGALRPDGVLSIPVSIRDFPAYATRMLATVRAALLASGDPDPAAHVMVVRSAWNVRILVRPTPWPAAAIASARKWADDRSFDMSYYPGIDVAAARAGIYNDLPPVSFETGTVVSGDGMAQDAVADEAGAALAGQTTSSGRSFDLSPITESRPFYYDVLRLDRLGLILRRIEMLPQAEIGPLVNLAVLAQALVLALLVLCTPFLAGRRAGSAARPAVALRLVCYFGALGLGFLFIEIAAIEKVAFLLNDRATAFSLVLTVMLVGSGLGSLLSARFRQTARPALLVTALVVGTTCLGFFWLGDQVILGLSGWSGWARGAVAVLALAPASVALGLPFPLGLARLGPRAGFVLPWAWAVNGAFSVVATPLANLLAVSSGLDRVLLAAALLYAAAVAAFPGQDRGSPCPTRSP